jgi:hypothetical protein
MHSFLLKVKEGDLIWLVPSAIPNARQRFPLIVERTYVSQPSGWMNLEGCYAGHAVELYRMPHESGADFWFGCGTLTKQTSWSSFYIYLEGEIHG